MGGHGRQRRYHIKAEVARQIWEAHYGERFEGEVAMHLCDEGRCGEPSHITPGTFKDNTQDASKKGRMRNTFEAGEAHWNARLTDVDVADIREAVAAGTPRRMVAETYGLNPATVGRIVLGQRRGGGQNPVD